MEQTVTRLLCLLVGVIGFTSANFTKPSRRPSTTALLADPIIANWLQEIFYSTGSDWYVVGDA
jgi:hypothetical protein